MGCGVGRVCGSNLALLWLWHRLVATAPIRPLAWGEEKEKKKKDKKKKKKKRIKNIVIYKFLGQ